MSKRTPIKLRAINNSRYPYCLVVPAELSDTGKVQKRYFSSRRAGEAVVTELRTRKENFGIRMLSMPEAIRIEAVRCSEALQLRNATLSQATEHYIAFLEGQQRSCTFSELAEKTLAAKRKRNRSVRYLSDLVADFNSFAETHGDSYVNQISAKDVEQWVHSLGKIAPSTFNGHLRQLATAFSYAISMGYCERNPVSRVEKATEEPGICEILTPDEVMALLRAADDTIIPMIVVQAFAGLRPSEAERISFENLRFKQKDVQVNRQKARSSAHRNIDMEANLEAWLAPYQGRTGAICPKGYREKWDKVRAKAGLLKKWPYDGLRHSYGSYHYGKYRDIAKLASLMGHSNTQTTRRHYLKRLDDPEDATTYWSITPELIGVKSS